MPVRHISRSLRFLAAFFFIAGIAVASPFIWLSVKLDPEWREDWEW